MNGRLALLVALCAHGCTLYSYTNVPLPAEASDAAPARAVAGPTATPAAEAAFEVPRPRGQQDVVFVLALSGGGSRAAYFASEVMLRLADVYDDVDLLHEVDVISSVSGGSIAAAYYCITGDSEGDPQPEPAPSGRVWEPDGVRRLMRRDYQGRWIRNWFWPTNILKYWFTAYDRADIMAQTLADNLYDRPFTGTDLRFADLNPERPYLIINATDATQHTPQRAGPDGVQEAERHFGEVFTFTAPEFARKLGSDLSDYSIARAVMASACFPSVFSYMTLRDFRHPDRYVHVFDGGNADNLGLLSVSRLIQQLEADPGHRPAQYIVISVDAFTNPQGVPRDVPDPRSGWDYLVDTNFLASVDSLLQVNRRHTLEQFESGILDRSPAYEVRQDSLEAEEPLFTSVRVEPEKCAKLGNLLFWHLQFADVGDPELVRRLNRIPTSLALASEDAADIQEAVERLMTRETPELRDIRKKLGLQRWSAETGSAGDDPPTP